MINPPAYEEVGQSKSSPKAKVLPKLGLTHDSHNQIPRMALFDYDVSHSLQSTFLVLHGIFRWVLGRTVEQHVYSL